MKRPVAWAAAALVVLVVAGAIVVAVDSEPRRKLTERADRVLILSLPYVSWSDLEGPELPNLNKLFADSSIASLTTRTIGKTDLADGYLTLGAGTRATGGDTLTDGAAFGAKEDYGSDAAADVYQRQTGEVTRRGIYHLGLAPIIDANEEEDLDAAVGALGDALHDGGYSRAVIANGDGSNPGIELAAYRRTAAGALMGTDGHVPAGRVDAGILTQDAEAPFGHRLDLREVVDSFEQVWRDKAVVLVEASDLVRATEYQPLALKGWRRVLFKQALRASDRMLGQLLEQVDLDRDAVIVVSPVPSALGETLTVMSVHAPGVEPGLLRSPSLRRPGFVQIVDVGPTILDLVGIPRPAEIHGRPITVARTERTAVERRAFLANEIEAADFRDEVLNIVIVTFVVLQAALALGAVLVLIGRLGRTARARVRFAALALLAFIPVVYLARLFPFHNAKPLYPLFLIAASLALARAYQHFGRNREIDPPIIALGVIVTLLIGDVLFGARLQLDSAFGYTPNVGVRISGFGNISYAALAAATILLAGLVAHRVGGRRGAWVAIAIMGVAIVVDVAPFLGADVGGVLSMIPAFGITAALLLGIQVRAKLRTALVCLAAVVIGVALAAALDLSQPEEQRTHLGRFIEQVRDEGWSTVTNTISHKLSQNLATITSIWGLMLPGVLAFLAYLSFGPKRLRALGERIPELRKALIGFSILAVLGYVMNDSGINIPAMMLAVLNAVLVALLVRPDASNDDLRVKPKAKAAARVAR